MQIFIIHEKILYFGNSNQPYFGVTGIIHGTPYFIEFLVYKLLQIKSASFKVSKEAFKTLFINTLISSVQEIFSL